MIGLIILGLILFAILTWIMQILAANKFRKKLINLRNGFQNDYTDMITYLLKVPWGHKISIKIFYPNEAFEIVKESLPPIQDHLTYQYLKNRLKGSTITLTNIDRFHVGILVGESIILIKNLKYDKSYI